MLLQRECRALIAEDSVLALLGLEFELKQQGIEVVGVASTIVQALEKAQTTVIDIAILDINLRGEMIFPVVDLLLLRGIPIIFTTGYDPEHMLPPRYSGLACLRKPYDPTALIAMISQTLMQVKATGPAPAGPLNRQG